MFINDDRELMDDENEPYEEEEYEMDDIEYEDEQESEEAEDGVDDYLNGQYYEDLEEENFN